MNSKKLLIACLMLISLAAGCIPEKRIAWTSKGDRAAVATPTGLFIVDAKGKVLPPRLANTPARCAWLSDDKTLAVVHAQKAKRWEDLAPLLDAGQVARVEREAKALRARIKEYKGDWDAFKIDAEDGLSGGTESAVCLYLRDKLADGLAEHVGTKWSQFEALEANIWLLQTYEADEKQLAPGRVILKSLEEIREPRPSPNDQLIAFLMTPADSRDDDVLSLYVAPLSGGQARQVSPGVAMHFDWSPDSTSLAYLRSNMPTCDEEGSVQLGSLTTVTVARPDGKLLDQWVGSSDRAGVLFHGASGVDWLSDGRLIFSSAELNLPATVRDMPQQWALFVLDPRTPAGVTRILGRDFPEQLEPGLPMFEVSPDEKRVLLVGEKGRIHLYEFASGKSTTLTPSDDPEGKMRALPSWRGNDGVTFVAPAVSAKTKGYEGQVLLMIDDKSTCISSDWTKEMKQGWLSGD
jgi:hypothetical protein